MSSSVPSPEFFLVYWNAFRRDSHQLLAWGYEDAYAAIKSKSGKKFRQEEEITGFIVQAIQERLRSPECPQWCQRYSIKEEFPVSWAGRTGKRRWRTDIIIEYTSRGRAEYIFEAKRLQGSGYGVKKYVEDGLNRFVSGKYASRYPEAGMLGYIQDGSLITWNGKIKLAIETGLNGKYNLNLIKPLHAIKKKISRTSLGWISLHKRNGSSNIAIYHILLDSIC